MSNAAIQSKYNTIQSDYNSITTAIQKFTNDLNGAAFTTYIGNITQAVKTYITDITNFDATVSTTLASDITAVNKEATTLSGYPRGTPNSKVTTCLTQLTAAINKLHANVNSFIIQFLSSGRTATTAAATSTATAAAGSMPYSSNDQLDPSNGYIIAVPLKKNVINQNTYTATGILYDNTNPNYNPNGKYVISCSSYSDASHNSFNAFNGSKTLSWMCNNVKNSSANIAIGQTKYTQDPYSGEVMSAYVGGGGINVSTNVVGETLPIAGEWIQITLPYSIYLQKYSILTPSNSFPRIFYVLGSSDNGKTWDIAQLCSLVSKPPVVCNGVAVDPNEYMSSNYRPLKSYSTYRLVINQAADNISSVTINQWNLWGTIVNITETFTNLSTRNISMNRQLSYFNIDEHIQQYSLVGTVRPVVVEGLTDAELLSANTVSTTYLANSERNGNIYTNLNANMKALSNDPKYNFKTNTVTTDSGVYSMTGNALTGNTVALKTHVKTMTEVMGDDNRLKDNQQQMLFSLGIVCLATLLIVALSVAKE